MCLEISSMCLDFWIVHKDCAIFYPMTYDTNLNLWRKQLKKGSFSNTILTPWQPMRSSLGSVLRFSRCFYCKTHKKFWIAQKCLFLSDQHIVSGHHGLVGERAVAPGYGTICGKAEEVAWWMEPLGSFSRVLNVLPREKIEGPPRDFLKANSRPHPRADKRLKTEGPQALRGFGLWSGRGCGHGFTFKNPERGLQYSSEGVHWVLKGPHEGSIHHDTFEAFPEILILFT